MASRPLSLPWWERLLDWYRAWRQRARRRRQEYRFAREHRII